MYDPQDDEATREADAVDATDMAPTVMSAPGSGAVVDAFAWSQEDGSAGAEPVPYVEDPYDQDLATGRRPATPPPPPVPGRRGPSLVPRVALGVGILVALIAVAGALYSLTRAVEDEAPVAPETSAVVVPPAPSPSAAPSPSIVPKPSEPAPPPVVTTSAPPETTTEAPPTTTTAPPTTTTTAPPSTTTTTSPPTTTTTVPTTTVPPSSSEPPSTTVPPATTVPMTTEYLRIPLVPIPIPITVPQN